VELVGAVVLAVLGVLGVHGLMMEAPEDEHPVEVLASEGTHLPITDGVRPRA